MGATPALQRHKAWSGSAAVVSSSAVWVLETKAGRTNPIFVTVDGITDADLELLEVRDWINQMLLPLGSCDWGT